MNVSNGKCIRDLSRKSLRANRTRNLIAVLAIALTTVLFTSLFTIALSINDGFQQNNFRQVGGYSHGGFKYLTEAQYEALKDDPLYQARLGMGDRPNFAAMPVGESAQQVTDRVSIGLEKTAADAARRGFGRVGVVSHGGDLMALLAKYGRPERDY